MISLICNSSSKATEVAMRDSVTPPEGWTETKLGSIGRYLNGRAFKTSEWSKKGRPIVRIQDLTGSNLNPNYFEGEVEDRHVVRSGDFLISWSATLGAYIWDGPEAVLNQHIFKVVSNINKRFHYYLVRDRIEELQRNAHGSGIVHVTKGVFENTPVILPTDLAIQAAVADVLDRVEASQLSAVKHLAAARRAIERFRQAVLAAACSGRLTSDWREGRTFTMTSAQLADFIESHRRESLGCRWKESSVGEIGGLWEIPAGWTWTNPDRLSRPERSLTYGVIKLGEPTEDGVPTLRSSDVRWLRITDNNVKRISRQIADNYKRTYLEGGEVVVTVRGSLGGVAVVPPEMAGWNVSREVAVIPLVSAVDARYIAYAIASTLMLPRFRGQSSLGRAGLC
ncbi:MAG: restriction endonuclease subunit S [Coriobacteriia bacterium]